MAQFDSFIISSLSWSLIISLLLYYSTVIKYVIPNFAITIKFRGKKLDLHRFYNFLNENLEIKNRTSVTSLL